MALIEKIHALNRKISGRHYYPLRINQQVLGFIDSQLLDTLSTCPLFMIQKPWVDLTVPSDIAEKTVFEETLTAFFKDYFAAQHIKKWRNERYAICEQFGQTPYFLLERSILSYLGLTGYGVHINGYVKKADGLYLWVAKRSQHKPTSPGKLDQIAAGGQPYDMTVFENMLKECQEEASIPESLAKTARPVSAISYCYDLKTMGMRPDIIFNYDLALPADFVPQVNDHEVESFNLLPIEQVLEIIDKTDDFKFNSAAVVIDFAIRHGVIDASYPDYVLLQAGMHQREQYLQSLIQQAIAN